MNNLLVLTIMKPSILVGGQAVINGVMIRVPGAYATAVRDSDQNIQIDQHKFISKTEKSSFWKFPFFRGIISLFESMKIGLNTLQWSANIALAEEESESESKIQIWLTNAFAILLSLVLFIGCPYWITTNLFEIEQKALLFNLTAGLIRIGFFLLYLVGISMLKDVKILFQYHGAEHRVIYNFESGKELNVKNAQSFPTQHPRCGTSFMFIVLLSTIFVFAFIDSAIIFFYGQINILLRVVFHLPLIPIAVGIAYEIIKLTSRSDNFLLGWLQKPGLWLQNITTKPPENNMVEIAIKALKTAFGDTYNKFSGRKFKAEAIG